MQRLILIGNGFDLAHKMETRYSDFMINYIKGCILEAYDNKDYYYEDKLLIVKFNKPQLIDLDKLVELKDLNQFNITSIVNRNNKDNPRIYLNHYEQHLVFTFYVKYDFIDALLKMISLNNWVDFEQYYFSYLCAIKDQIEKIKLLNEGFDHLRITLGKYIAKQEPDHLLEAYNKIFSSKMNNKYFYNSPEDYHRKESHLFPDRTLFLNFNYTSTINRYIEKYGYNDSYSEIQIHGEAKSNLKSIVLGYGDELNEKYKDIRTKHLEHARFFKNYWYSKNNNYQKFEHFINSGRYEVCILGHSCGSSDGVLLRTIFEHINCKLIHIYKHIGDAIDGSDFFARNHNISKIITFEKQPILRTLLLDEESSYLMPQL